MGLSTFKCNLPTAVREFASTVIPEAAAGGYPGPISPRIPASRWIPALAALGRDDNRRLRRFAGAGIRKALRQAGLGHLPVQRLAGQRLGDDLARRDQFLQIDAGVEPEGLGEKYHVLGDDIAG